MAAPTQASTIHRDGPTKRGGRTTAVVFLTILLLLEIGLRILEPGLPIPLDWPIENMQDKFDQMSTLAESDTAIDVAFVGSSVVYDGIDPEAINASETGIVAYNAAIAGAISTRTWRWWTTHVIVPKLNPDAVAIGLTPVSLNGSVPDTFWSSLTLSRGFGRVEAGSGSSILARIEKAIEDNVALFRLRTILREPVRVAQEFGEGADSSTGIGPFGANPKEDVDDYDLTESVVREFEDEQLRDFSLDGRPFAELESLIQDLKRERVQVIMINMPVTDDLMRLFPGGPDDYGRYLREIEALAEREGISLIDFGREISSTNRFHDPVHLNPIGAVEFSRRLADELQSILR